jgi:hypothetical protein
MVRLDLPFDEAYPTNTVAVAKVLATQEEAEAEVARLNKLRADKGCTHLQLLLSRPLRSKPAGWSCTRWSPAPFAAHYCANHFRSVVSAI